VVFNGAEICLGESAKKCTDILESVIDWSS